MKLVSLKRWRSSSPCRDDTAFLPSALEILDTPASPVRVAFIWFICMLAVSVLAWAWFGRIDVVATAQGKVQPAGRVKIIQSVEAGKIVSNPLPNGTHVEAGQQLLQLDETQVRAELSAIESSLAAWQAESIRRRAVDEEFRKLSLDAVKDMDPDPTCLLDRLGEELPIEIRRREMLAFHADLAALVSSLRALDAQRARHLAEVDSLTGNISAREELLATLSERVTMRSTLIDGPAGSRARVLDALEIKQKEMADLSEKQGRLQETRAAIGAIEREAVKLIDAAIADNVGKLSETERRVDTETQSAIKVRRQLELLTILAPVSGTIQASAVTTPGQVISAGSELMRIVQDDSVLEIEAYLPNVDIGFVSVGQEAAIKIEAFPFTRYGILPGRVTHVARDAIPEPDAQQSEQQAAAELRAIVPVSNAQRVQNLVFPITIAPATYEIVADGRSVPLRPGMAVTVEIKTGRRRILEYLFSPLAEIAAGAMHER